MPFKVNVKERLVGNTIDLSMTELHEVPMRELAALKKGTILDMSNNSLITLGKKISSLTHLIELDLSKNLLKELPEDFGELTALRRLDLYGNKLQHLPLSFSQLKELKWLDLKCNPLVPRLAEIAGPCEETKDCEDCARNVVEALSRTALEIEEERKRRLKEQLRDKEKEEQELLAKKDVENGKKKKKKEKAKVNEKPVLPNPAKNVAVKETIVKETVVKDNSSKPNSAKEKKPKNIAQRVKKAPQQAKDIAIVKDRNQVTQADRKTKKHKGGSVCSRFILGCIWLFLLAMLAAVSVVTFALWDRSLFEMSASKLGPQGGVVVQYVLKTITGLTSK